MSGKSRLDIQKFRSELKKELFYFVGKEDIYKANLKVIKSVLRAVDKIPHVDFHALLASEIKTAIKNIRFAADDAAEFYQLMSKERSRRRRRGGRQLPPTTFMELVVVALEMAKGDKELLHAVRATLTYTSSSEGLEAADESIYRWIKEMTKLQRRARPTLYDVTPKNYGSGTSWSEQIKSKYLTQLHKRYNRPFPRSPLKGLTRSQALEIAMSKWQEKLGTRTSEEF